MEDFQNHHNLNNTLEHVSAIALDPKAWEPSAKSHAKLTKIAATLGFHRGSISSLVVGSLASDTIKNPKSRALVSALADVGKAIQDLQGLLLDGANEILAAVVRDLPKETKRQAEVKVEVVDLTSALMDAMGDSILGGINTVDRARDILELAMQPSEHKDERWFSEVHPRITEQENERAYEAGCKLFPTDADRAQHAYEAIARQLAPVKPDCPTCMLKAKLTRRALELFLAPAPEAVPA